MTGDITGSDTGTLVFVVCALGISLILILLGVYMNAAIYHLFLMIIKGAKFDFEATLRIVCYSQGSVAIWMVLPQCGGAICWIWSIIAAIVGISKVHNVSMGKAVFAVLVPLALLFCLCCVVIFIVFFLP